MLNLARKLKTKSGCKIINLRLLEGANLIYPLSAELQDSAGNFHIFTYTKEGKQINGQECMHDLIYADEEPENMQIEPQKPLSFKEKVDTFRSKLGFIDAITRESFVNALAENSELYESFRTHFIRVFNLALTELVKKD